MSSAQGDGRRKSRLRLRLQQPARLWGWLFLAFVLAAVWSGSLPSAQAQGWEYEDAGATRRVVVTLYKSRTLRLDKPFASAVVGSSEIVDALPMSDRALYIQGKKIGTTNVSVFDQGMKLIGIIDVEVALDTGNMQEKIRASTGSGGIRVVSNNGQIVLSGVAGNAVAAERAVSIARSLLGEGGSVVNAMTIAPTQQVMLRVRFLEVARSASREIGVNWFGANNAGNRGFNTGVGAGVPLGRPAVPGVDPGGNPVIGSGLPLFGAFGTLLSGASPFGVAIANLTAAGQSLDVVLSALETKGLIRRLAEPDLVALSGDTAAFLAGGEFPVPSVQPGSSGGVPVITTDYKPFGVQLTFQPTVLANGIINLRLAPSVSELDFAQSVQISGFSVPSLTKREARTTVELRDGQSFAIAGLLSAISRRDIQQLPWIGSVPVLGALFRSNSYRQEETDLVVIVTPHLVAPGVPGQQLASPLDNHTPTNDVDFFLMGQMEQRKIFRDYITSGGGLQGPYGHMLGSQPGAVLSTKN
jgi:pilus assembly protein CpaC